MCKQLFRPLIGRSAMGHKGIVNIKNNSSITFSIEVVKINLVSGFQIFIRVKLLKHMGLLSLLPVPLTARAPHLDSASLHLGRWASPNHNP